MTDNAENKTPVILGYVRPTGRLRRHLRLILAVAVLFIVVGTCYWQRERWILPYWHHLQLLPGQEACLSASELPDFVVYEEDPIQVAKLVRIAGYVIERRMNDNNVAMFHEACLVKFERLAPHPSLSRFYTIADGATVFLHERRSSHGSRRLVLVECLHVDNLGPSTGFDSFILTSSMMDPAVFSAVPGWTQRDFSYDFYQFGAPNRQWHPPAIPERIFSGQPDPSDPAHFTIRCQVGPQDWFIDGRLEDTDADLKVTLSPHAGRIWDSIR